MMKSWKRGRGLKRPIHPIQIIGARASGGPGGPFNFHRNEKGRKEKRKKIEKKRKKSFGPNSFRNNKTYFSFVLQIKVLSSTLVFSTPNRLYRD